jgi:aspartyl-tRNA(Asn)/glutamyl-tRNA(Gln) amidotransferase subunit A
MTTPELTRLSIAEAGEMIRKRKLSPLELTEACLDRIGQTDARLNAFITVAREDSLRSAHQAANAIAAGNYKGPLHGIPVALKDLFDTAGLRTTAGSKIMADNVPAEDAEATARLKAAGAVILGKLNMHEFAFGATGVNPHYGPARNPWAMDRITGGSSSGSGASVAAGQCFAALGTDTGCSIRAPASLCGVIGLKPTFGRVSSRGVVPLSWSLDHVGPLARTAEDAAIVLAAIAGRDPLDESSLDEPVPDYRRALKGGAKRLRIGVPENFLFENVDTEVEQAVRAAIDALSKLGAEVGGVRVPHVEDAGMAVNAIMLSEALAYHQRWLAERPGDYGEDLRQRLEMGVGVLGMHYVQAQRFREMMVRAWRDEMFDRVDLLAFPTTPIPAPPIEDSDLSTTMSLVRFNSPIDLSGNPAVSVPCGFTKGGLPVGLQLVGRWWEEETVLRAAHAYQRATEWHNRTPPL